jgi:hypothetical protein
MLILGHILRPPRADIYGGRGEAEMQVIRDEAYEKVDPIEPSAWDVSRPDPVAPAVEYPLVLVEWHDAWFDYDLACPEDRSPDYVVRTIGFLVADGPRFLSLAQEVLPEDGGFRAVTHIPIAIVERMTELPSDSSPLAG